MKTYVINLERSVHRREHILGEVNRFGLDYELIKAVDGAKMTDEERERLCDMNEVRKYPEWLSPGMLGCSLSHYNVYRKIIEDNVDIALVLEDDVILPDSLPVLLDEITQQIAENEVISLYYFSLKPCVLSDRDVVPLSNGFTLRYPMDVNQPITTAGYVITNAAALTLADIILPVRVGPDSWGYFYENNGFESFRCVYPVPLVLTAAKSDIHNSTLRGTITKFIDDYKVPGFYSLVRALRKREISSRSKIELIDQPSPVGARK